MRALLLALLNALYINPIRLKKEEDCRTLAEALEGHPDAKQFLTAARR